MKASKSPNRTISWGLQVIAICSALLLFSVIGTIAVINKAYAIDFQSHVTHETNTASITSTDTSTPNPTNSPQSTPVTPQPTAVTPKPTVPPPTPTNPPPPPTPTPTTAPIQQPNVPPAGGGILNPTPTDSPSPTATSIPSPSAVATTVANTAPTTVTTSRAKPSDGIMGTIVGPASVVGATVAILLLATLLVGILVRRRQTPPLRPAWATGQLSPNMQYAQPTPFTPALQASVYNTQSAPGSNSLANDATIPYIPIQAALPLEYSPLLNDRVIPQSGQQAFHNPEIQSSDLNPLPLDYPIIVNGNSRGIGSVSPDPAIETGDTPLPSQPTQATPEPSTPLPEPVPVTASTVPTDSQLIQAMQQAKMGIFVVPGREKEG